MSNLASKHPTACYPFTFFKSILKVIELFRLAAAVSSAAELCLFEWRWWTGLKFTRNIAYELAGWWTSLISSCSYVVFLAYTYCFGSHCYMLAFGIPALLMIIAIGKQPFREEGFKHLTFFCLLNCESFSCFVLRKWWRHLWTGLKLINAWLLQGVRFGLISFWFAWRWLT